MELKVGEKVREWSCGGSNDLHHSVPLDSNP